MKGNIEKAAQKMLAKLTQGLHSSSMLRIEKKISFENNEKLILSIVQYAQKGEKISFYVFKLCQLL